MLATLLLLVRFSSLQTPAKDPPPKVKVVRESGPPERCVDVLFVGDGYVEKDLAGNGKYWKDVQRYAKRLFEVQPFADFQDSFNVRALMLASQDRGCDVDPNQEKVHTALECHLDKPDGRLLTFKDAARLKLLVEAAGPVDIVFVMVNTEIYGGAGTVLDDLEVRDKPCPAPTFSAQDTRSFMIAVHELGHSFAGLADEYIDEATAPTFPLPDKDDVVAANVTLAKFIDRSSFERLLATAKWKHFLELPGAKKSQWAQEGGYYRATGVFRPWPTCMMRNHDEPYCPICCEEMAKAIQAACGQPWDDAAWHKSHPLATWH